MNINSLIIPSIVLIIIIYAYIKKVSIIDEFIKGVKTGYQSTITIFPTILAMLLATNIFIGSNIIKDIFTYLTNYLNIKTLPVDVIPLIILKPISASASLALLNNILTNNHPDSYIGMLSSIMCASTDTTIYIIATYFATIKIRKTNNVLKVGLLTDALTVLIVLLVSHFFFK